MKDVTIYTSDTCHFCHLAKEFMDRNNVKYTEKNVSRDKDAMMELRTKGFTGVPVIIVGEETIFGFDQEKLEKALGL